VGSGVHRHLFARLGSRSSRRKGTKLNTFHQVRVKGAVRKTKAAATGKRPWARVKEML
jgi:hypothetical protein